MNKQLVIAALASAFCDGLFSWVDEQDIDSDLQGIRRAQLKSIKENAAKMGVVLTRDEIDAELTMNGGWAVNEDHEGADDEIAIEG